MTVLLCYVLAPIAGYVGVVLLIARAVGVGDDADFDPDLLWAAPPRHARPGLHVIRLLTTTPGDSHEHYRMDPRAVRPRV